MRVTAKVKLATEKSIRTAAYKLFIRKGLDATSTREIARVAKVAVGTVFNYFPSKEALAFALATDAFAAGRARAMQRLADAPSPSPSLEEDLFTLVASDIRALEPIRPFIAGVLDAGLSPFMANAISPEAAAIRTGRLEDAAGVLAGHGLGDAATAAVMHLYWSLYLGVLSFWAADTSPNQEDTWAILDRSVRMFAGALKPAAAAPQPAASSNSPTTTPSVSPKEPQLHSTSEVDS